MLRLILIIGTGSFIGGVSRFLVSHLTRDFAPNAFPFGTFIVNITGCFLIGLFYGLSERGDLLNHELRMFLTAGFCGGFTTFSAFVSENMTFLNDGNFFQFSLYTGLSVFVGLMATYSGNLVTKIF